VAVAVARKGRRSLGELQLGFAARGVATGDPVRRQAKRCDGGGAVGEIADELGDVGAVDETSGGHGRAPSGVSVDRMR
jgi:hypothetical protein